MTTIIEPPARTRRGAVTAPARTAPAAAPARTARDSSIDLARAWCLVIVVGLHALMVGVSVSSGAAQLENAMDGWSGFAALSWLAQVMPLFFVLGGFSSATQWTRLRTRGVSGHAYVAMRMRRLLPPALGAMGVTALALLALALSGVPGEIVAIAGFRMGQVLWFLGVYLLCTALVPLMVRLHRSAPWATVAVLAALVVGVDAARLATEVQAIGFANLLFVWLLLQQFGFFLAEDRLPARRGSLAAGVVLALGSLAALCLSGLYSPDLYVNLNPPTVVLVLLGVAQLFLFQLARPALRRAATVRPVAAAMNAVNARAMTIYSWHMLVLIGLAALLLVTVGEGLPEPLSVAWWVTRPAWFVAVAVAVGLVVALVGRREAAAARTRSELAPPAWRAVTAFTLAGTGVLVVLVLGAAPTAWLAGAVLLLLSLRFAR